MTAGSCIRGDYLDELAMVANSTTTRPADVSCAQLRDIWRYATELHDRGVSELRIRAWGRQYALRLDSLGPDEFDRRAIQGVI